MSKPGNKNQSNISNIYGRIPGANDISKDRYTDPVVPGVGSPYDQTVWQDLKKGVKTAAGKVKGYIEENYPKAAEFATSIGESSPVINFLTKPRPEIQTGGSGSLISKIKEGYSVGKNLEKLNENPNSSNKQTSSGVTVEGMGLTPGSSEGTITSRYQGDEEVPLTPADKRKNRRSARKDRKAAKGEEKNN